MKKGFSFIAVILIAMMATSAFAFKTGGEFATDVSGTKYSTNFAPNYCAKISLTKKQIASISLSTASAYKFWVRKTVDNSAGDVSFKLGELSSWSDTAAVQTTGESNTVGKGITTAGFGAYSSATAANDARTVYYCTQTR